MPDGPHPSAGRQTILNEASEVFGTLLYEIAQQACIVKELLRVQLKNETPLDHLIGLHYLFLNLDLFHRHYDEWLLRRVRKVLELYEGEFKGARILELGGGLGDIGAIFAEMGAEVVSLEARRVNQRFANIKHRNIPGFKSVLGNVEDDFTHLGRFDLVINFGLLEVVKDPAAVLKGCVAVTNRVFVETQVCDSEDPNMVCLADLADTGCDSPLHGKSARPSPAWVEKVFKSVGFKVNRVLDADLNTRDQQHQYDWVLEKSTGPTVVDISHRRFWYFTR